MLLLSLRQAYRAVPSVCAHTRSLLAVPLTGFAAAAVARGSYPLSTAAATALALQLIPFPRHCTARAAALLPPALLMVLMLLLVACSRPAAAEPPLHRRPALAAAAVLLLPRSTSPPDQRRW